MGLAPYGKPRFASLIRDNLIDLKPDGSYRLNMDYFDYCTGLTMIYTTGQKRRMTPAIKREMRRRAAVEPLIGHIKNEHRMGRNYLAHTQGDAINAILAAVGYNFRLFLTWLRLLLRLLLVMLFSSVSPLHA